MCRGLFIKNFSEIPANRIVWKQLLTSLRSRRGCPTPKHSDARKPTEKVLKLHTLLAKNALVSRLFGQIYVWYRMKFIVAVTFSEKATTYSSYGFCMMSSYSILIRNTWTGKVWRFVTFWFNKNDQSFITHYHILIHAMIL